MTGPTGNPDISTVARLHGRHDIRLHREQRPVAGPGEALVRVTAVGLCGSDRHWFEDAGIGETWLTGPMVLGHEIAGVIEGGPLDGTRVAIDPSQPCRECDTCRRGREDLCPSTLFAGYGGTDGGLRTWMTWPAQVCVPVPDAIDDAEASCLEALGVALHAVDLAEVGPGSRVAVIGAGPIGLLVIRALRAAGVDDVVASDVLTHRVLAAMASGADVAWSADAGAQVGVDGVDVAIEVAGGDAAVDASIHLARPGGRVVLVGIPGDDHTTFRASVVRRKGLTLAMSRRMKADDLPRAVTLVASGAISLDGIVSHRFRLDDVASAFETLVARRGHKVIVLPGDVA